MQARNICEVSVLKRRETPQESLMSSTCEIYILSSLQEDQSNTTKKPEVLSQTDACDLFEPEAVLNTYFKWKVR